MSATPKNLDRYSSQIRRAAAKAAAGEQALEIRKQKFRASLVDDPLRPTASIAPAIERARNRKSG
ncbi:MAG: hypothetical protein KDJ36_08335 [Hyphomicrobiaceae bacterium]|nr:hypothetical protein [Hyphomicrobiaceae bacterium]